jgi:hypothetical protein
VWLMTRLELKSGDGRFAVERIAAHAVSR